MRYLLLVGLAAACSKTEPCEDFVNKSRPVLERSAAGHGKQFTEQDVVTLIGRCHDNAAKADPADRKVMDCVLAAKDDATIDQCWAGVLSAPASPAAPPP